MSTCFDIGLQFADVYQFVPWSDVDDIEVIIDIFGDFEGTKPSLRKFMLGTFNQ